MKYFIKAPAKINLFLDVLGKREDGYHEIRSVMQSVSLYDEISLEMLPCSDIKIELSGSNKLIKWDESNLAYKACALLLSHLKIGNAHIKIHIEKNIPIGAGMAGGSADASGTLILLNQALGFPLSTDELCELGSKLGADIPFCIKGGTCLCEGIGEVLTPITSFSGAYMLCAIDDSSISTPQAYKMLDEKYGDFSFERVDISPIMLAIEKNDVFGVASNLYNKFESVIIAQNPKINEIKDIMLKCGAIGTLMSGSGPSVFGIFPSEITQKNAFFALQSEKIQAFLCKSL